MPPGRLRVIGNRVRDDEFFIPDDNDPRSLAIGQEWMRRRGLLAGDGGPAAGYGQPVEPYTPAMPSTPLAAYSGGGAVTVSPPQVTVHARVYVGDREITDIARGEVDRHGRAGRPDRQRWGWAGPSNPSARAGRGEDVRRPPVLPCQPHPHHPEAKMTGARVLLPLLYLAWTHSCTPDGQWVNRRHAVREGDLGVALCRGQLSTTPGAERWWDRSRHEAQDCLSCFAAAEDLAEVTTGVRQ